MSEKFDFSKPEDQKKFEQLNPKEKQELMGESQDEAYEIEESAQAYDDYYEEEALKEEEEQRLLLERYEKEALKKKEDYKLLLERAGFRPGKTDVEYDYSSIKGWEAETIKSRMMDMIRVIKENDIQAVFFLDKSARPLSWILSKIKGKFFEKEKIPEIMHINVGKEKEYVTNEDWESDEEEGLEINSTDYEKLRKDWEHLGGKNILVVDEYVATGESLENAQKLLEKMLQPKKVTRFEFLRCVSDPDSFGPDPGFSWRDSKYREPSIRKTPEGKTGVIEQIKISNPLDAEDNFTNRSSLTAEYNTEGVLKKQCAHFVDAIHNEIIDMAETAKWKVHDKIFFTKYNYRRKNDKDDTDEMRTRLKKFFDTEQPDSWGNKFQSEFKGYDIENFSLSGMMERLEKDVDWVVEKFSAQAPDGKLQISELELREIANMLIKDYAELEMILALRIGYTTRGFFGSGDNKFELRINWERIGECYGEKDIFSMGFDIRAFANRLEEIRDNRIEMKKVGRDMGRLADEIVAENISEKE
jgi:adenine/guanine phosphoribosyltransferase-like PRPP-binding protein